MSLTDDLKDQISKHLPGMVGEELQRRLVQADKDAEAAKRLAGMREQLDKAVEENKIFKSFETLVSHREQEVDKRTRDIELREKLIELREKHAADRVSELRGVVAEVFANNRLKYQENYGHSGYVSNGSTSHSGTRTVEQQG